MSFVPWPRPSWWWNAWRQKESPPASLGTAHPQPFCPTSWQATPIRTEPRRKLPRPQPMELLRRMRPLPPRCGLRWPKQTLCGPCACFSLCPICPLARLRKGQVRFHLLPHLSLHRPIAPPAAGLLSRVLRCAGRVGPCRNSLPPRNPLHRTTSSTPSIGTSTLYPRHPRHGHPRPRHIPNHSRQSCRPTPHRSRRILLSLRKKPPSQP